MSVYALIHNGLVVGLFQPQFPNLPISEQISPDLNPVDVSGLAEPPAIGSSYDGKTFTAPPPLPAAHAPAQPTLAELQAQLATLTAQINALAAAK